MSVQISREYLRRRVYYYPVSNYIDDSNLLSLRIYVLDTLSFLLCLYHPLKLKGPFSMKAERAFFHAETNNHILDSLPSPERIHKQLSLKSIG